MNPIALTVNGEARRVEVEARTQLAEVLRDYLRLTGTHLGCEQGVCGACTVLVDGRPMRSCILYAGSCDGAEVRTIEGFGDDALMDELRRAFARHHALQCGFCTPGMLITARDVVRRTDGFDPVRIRHELSGNLCRCTGYVGIVAAIAEVIDRRGGGVPVSENAVAPGVGLSPAARPRGFAPFVPASERSEPAPESPGAARTEAAMQDGWTIVRRSFALASPLEPVWSLFEDTERVCLCIPGVELVRCDEAQFAGTVGLRFGPIHARLAGEGTRRSDPASRSGVIEGSAREVLGRSDVRIELRYSMREDHEGRESTAVDLDLGFRIQGALAQFNRPSVVESFVELVLVDFVSNCRLALSGARVERAGPESGVGVLVRFARYKWSKWFSRRT